MIRLPAPLESLAPAERYALQLLVDLARLVPVDDPAADVVRIVVTDPPGKPPELRTLAGSRWLFHPEDGEVRVLRSALHWIADLASAAHEQRSEARDRYGRVPPEVNALVAAGLERHPVVSEAAVRLRQSVVAAAGNRPVRLTAPWPDGKRWAAAFTHDLDVVRLWPVFAGLRLLELALKGRLADVARVCTAALATVGRDPVGRGVKTLLDREAADGVRSTWFILCGTPSWRTMRAGDLTYSPESPAARGVMARVREAGHAIGLHGSFATMDRPAEFGAQRSRLQGLTSSKAQGVRQHFLRMRPGATQRAMREAGFSYDSSFGFPDRNGFRLGICDVVPMWDSGQQRDLGLDLVPLCWMDRALSKYRGIEDPAAWVHDALRLAERCRAVNGLWVGVWHPNLTPALGFPGAPTAYAELVQGIRASDPWIATLDDIVAWRRARRAARVGALAPDGRVSLVSHDPSVVLEEPAR